MLKSLLLYLTASAAIGISSFAQIAPPAHSSPWNILVEAGKGEFRGDPVCHPLDYQRGVGGDANHFRGHDIADFSSMRTGEIQRLLVQRQDAEFCAIYQQQYPAALVKLSPAKIETISGEPLLMTRDPNGMRTYNEAYWSFNADGPILLDLNVIGNTLSKLLPAGDEVRGDYGLDMAGLCYHSAVWKSSDCNACASAGTVVLKLGLEHHQLVVVRKLFDPDGMADASACDP